MLGGLTQLSFPALTTRSGYAEHPSGAVYISTEEGWSRDGDLNQLREVVSRGSVQVQAHETMHGHETLHINQRAASSP